MPALDSLHGVVKNALVKDGWTVTHDPLTLRLDGLKLFVDLGAERVLAAEKGARRIVVEIKTFPGRDEQGRVFSFDAGRGKIVEWLP